MDMDKDKILVVIPARYASSRFPGKPLARIGGVEMITRVCRRVASGGWRLIVATDDDRIARCVEDAGFRAVMTRADHPSGTDRVREATDLSGLDPEVVVNVQGDEPFIDPAQVEALVRCFDDPATQIATLVREYPADGDMAGLEDPGLVKVVTAADGAALYFSRSVIPYVRGSGKGDWPRRARYLTHVGIYAYRRGVLDEITDMPRGALETAESLEQLRWLQAGYRIATALTTARTVGIDTPEDLEAAEYLLATTE